MVLGLNLLIASLPALIPITAFWFYAVTQPPISRRYWDTHGNVKKNCPIDLGSVKQNSQKILTICVQCVLNDKKKIESFWVIKLINQSYYPSSNNNNKK
ncbi:hypothetical protein BLA29_013564 [Euroglyphus maynei]|uniref:Uncharacterized protein n=1 Tax=Euroglyphus maynei TaxID=6958 RepID=A0A1Y3BJA9_EURMA|nr:hypothetical protein BLA29_013564 [Euroglyphus maynei]